MTHRNNDSAIFDDWVSVAEFTREVVVRWSLRKIFHQVRGHHARVQRRTGTDEHNLACVREFSCMFAHTTERDFASARVDATLQRHAQRARLLEDFLEHEVLELAEFNLLKIEFQLANLGSQRHIVNCCGAETLARDARNRIVREHDCLCGVRDDCTRITCDHKFTVADPDHQRRTLARHDEDIWFLLTHHRDRIRTSHFTQRCLHSLL